MSGHSRNNAKYDTYGFRFFETHNDAICQLSAVGFAKITDPAYYWNGLTRIDGPLHLFQYTVSGYGHLDLGGKLHRVGPGQAFMVDIPSAHEYYLPSSSDHWEFYFILIRPANLQGKWLDLMSRMGHVVHIPPDSSVVQLLQEAYHAAARNHITDGFRASSIVYQFVMELYRFSTLHKKKKETWPPKIRQAVLSIEGRYNTLQSLEEIANEAGLSKYYFTRAFKSATGSTPMEYLTKIRMAKAVRLLRETELTLEEIAQQIGYANASYFIKVFRRWIGFSPGEFRLGKDLAAANRFIFD
ncbi:helix-turn-helix transcriptional regulator [Paenibacillus medicaginis]|uniref:AraC family transcriptional regulator n=1 Tax=Paenibacillus medicaginis TaxID=1470560 RepID=A0ABV5C4Z2_9BACL